MTKFAWGMIALLLLTGSAAWGADAAPADKPGPKRAEFDKYFAEWKKILEEMRQLYGDYRAAPPEKKPAIEKRFNELRAQGEDMMPKLYPAAEAAYLEAPNASKDLAEFMGGVVMDHFRNDNYEEALRVAKLLLDNKYPDKIVYALAGLAAFGVADFDAAENYLKVARDAQVFEKLSGELSQQAMLFLTELPFYKEAWKKEQKIREAEAKAGDLPRVLIKTSKGDLEIELFENEAPNTVANFVSLVQKGFYNGTPFHRVLPMFMAQGGDPTGTGAGGPGYSIPCECYKPNYRVHFRGSLSMAHAGRDTGGSQFFLTFRPTHHLDGKHTVFGRVVKGTDVLAKLQRIDPERSKGVQPDKIVEAKVLRNRNHPYEPKTLPDPRKQPAGKE